MLGPTRNKEQYLIPALIYLGCIFLPEWRVRPQTALLTPTLPHTSLLSDSKPSQIQEDPPSKIINLQTAHALICDICPFSQKCYVPISGHGDTHQSPHLPYE